jgi:hypothetical protein
MSDYDALEKRLLFYDWHYTTCQKNVIGGSAHCDCWVGKTSTLVVAAIRDLRAERDALKKDAERYRWLRDHQELPAGTGELRHGAYLAALKIAVDMHGDKWDAAIDAAIEQGEKPSRRGPKK